MLIGAFFVLRWANQNDKGEADEDILPEERPVGLVLPRAKASENEVDVRQEQEPSVLR